MTSHSIHLALAGTQSGYTVTWGTVTTNFDDGSAYVILTFSDDTSFRFDNENIEDLAGVTYNGVASITIRANSGGSNGYLIEIDGDPYVHEYTGMNSPGAYGVSGLRNTTGQIVLGDNLVISSFSISAMD